MQKAMNVFLVFAHAEPRSFNGALFRTAQDTLRAAGHGVTVSDLYAMKFDPVSDRRNFVSIKNSEFFKQQVEEMHATEVGGFAPDVEAELGKMEACDLMIWQFVTSAIFCPAMLATSMNDRFAEVEGQNNILGRGFRFFSQNVSFHIHFSQN
jgi:NAD(P)H dehydrogenase (quinone)